MCCVVTLLISFGFPPPLPPHILQAINNEEELLEWEMTPFPQIQMILQLSEPYQRLWNTAFNFHEKNEKWMNGEIATEILIMRGQGRTASEVNMFSPLPSTLPTLFQVLS